MNTIRTQQTYDQFYVVIVRNSSCGKVMFSQASVILGMCGKGGHAWQGGMCGWRHA